MYLLSDGSCQVWWATAGDAARPGLDALLDDGERARWLALRHERAAALYLVAHALVRLVLGPLVGTPPAALRFAVACRRCGGPHGKPALAHAGGLELSLSHAGNLVAVAVARGVAIGVDVEEVALRGAEVPVTALSGSERATLAALPAADRTSAFIRYWTRKEAVLKATGDGLAMPPSGVTVSPPYSPAAVLSWPDGPGVPIHLTDLSPRPGHVGCLAALAHPLRVVEHDGTHLLSGL